MKSTAQLIAKSPQSPPLLLLLCAYLPVAYQMARLTELHREGLISVPHRAEKLERAPFRVVYAGNNQRQTMEAITRQC